jgi:hypothetical protein
MINIYSILFFSPHQFTLSGIGPIDKTLQFCPGEKVEDVLKRYNWTNLSCLDVSFAYSEGFITLTDRLDEKFNNVRVTMRFRQRGGGVTRERRSRTFFDDEALPSIPIQDSVTAYQVSLVIKNQIYLILINN